MVQALGIFHGSSHMEVMYSDVTGPCLVEVGSRCHGGEGTWVPVAEECLGYSQLDTNLNAFLRPDRFDALPFEPGRWGGVQMYCGLMSCAVLYVVHCRMLFAS